MDRASTDEQGQAPRRKPGRPRAFDRGEALEAVTTCLWREGAQGISLNEICRQVNVSKPGIYREFGGEDGLRAAAIDHYRTQVVLPLLATVASDRPFDALLHELLTVLTTDRGAPLGCMLVEMRLERERLGPDATRMLDAVSAEMRAAYEARYARAVADGEARSDLDPSFAASYLDAQFSAVLMRMHRGDDPPLVRAHAWLALQALLPASGARKAEGPA